MTKKDYVIIAKVLNDFIATSVVDNEQVPIGHVKNLMDSLTYSLSLDNPRFDKLRFVEACIKGQTTLRYADLI